MLQKQVNQKVIDLLQEPSSFNDAENLKSVLAAKDFFKTCTDTGK